jgi:hypothetical protein
MKHDGTSHDGTLHELAKRLGSRASDRLDVEATAQKVLQRLREQPAHRGGPIWVQTTWLRIAAAVVILVGGVVTLRQIWPGSDDHVTHFIADDLSDLSTDELRTLLTSFDQIIGESAVPDSTSDLHELDAQQLRELLREG